MRNWSDAWETSISDAPRPRWSESTPSSHHPPEGVERARVIVALVRRHEPPAAAAAGADDADGAASAAATAAGSAGWCIWSCSRVLIVKTGCIISVVARRRPSPLRCTRSSRPSPRREPIRP